MLWFVLWCLHPKLTSLVFELADWYWYCNSCGCWRWWSKKKVWFCQLLVMLYCLFSMIQECIITSRIIVILRVRWYVVMSYCLHAYVYGLSEHALDIWNSWISPIHLKIQDGLAVGVWQGISMSLLGSSPLMLGKSYHHFSRMACN